MPDDDPIGVEIELDGQKFLVTEEFKKRFDEQAASWQKELEEARKVPEKPKEEKKTSEIDWEKAAQPQDDSTQKLRDEILTQVRNDMARAREEEQLWAAFYSKNADLKNYQDLVEFVFTKKKPEFAKLYEKDGWEKVAEELAASTRKMIQVEAKPAKAEPALVEGGPEHGIPNLPKQEEKIATMSDIIRKRRQQKIYGNKAG